MPTSRLPGHGLISSSEASRIIRPLTQLQLQRVQAFITANLNEKLLWSQIAHELHLSPSHLARRFKASTGLSLRQYIIEQRLQRAKNLLLESELAVAEIAAVLGFTDHSHLTRSFKSRFCITPQATRRPISSSDE